MKIIDSIITFIRATIVLLWTLFCGLFGILILLLTFNPSRTQMFTTRYVWSPVLLGVCGVKVNLHGRENINFQEASVYVANHASQFDIVALCRVMPITLFYVVKQELKKIPIIGWYIHALGHIFVDRKNPESAKISMRAAAQKIKSGKNLISFAEGTRTKTGELLLFRRGPFMIVKEGDLNVVPIAIEGSRHVLASGSFSPKPGVINIYIGKPISHNEYKNITVEELASLARSRVQAMLTDKKSI
jgi:1-acyl-sn-glycerol-3-phosphate acyltransferase